jgi:flavodoxin I
MGNIVEGRFQKTRVAVFYSSRGGNTKKVAQAIAGELGVEALDVSDVGEGYSMKKCDLVFAGSGNYGGSCSKEMEGFLKSIVPAEDRYGAVFGTAGGSGKGHLGAMAGLLGEKGVKIVGEWGCLGQEYSLKNKGKPDEGDLEDAREFAKKTLRKIEVI